jgi:cell division control protein 12
MLGLEDFSIPPPPILATALSGTGIANLPNQRHKIVAKNGANFTIMVCGKFLFNIIIRLYTYY